MARRSGSAENPWPAAILTLMIVCGLAAGVPLGSSLGYSISRGGLEAALFAYPSLAISGGLSAIAAVVGAFLWAVGWRIGPTVVAGGLSFALGIAGGYVLGPKFDPPEYLTGGTMVIHFDAPLSRTFEAPAACMTLSDSDVIGQVFAEERLSIGSERVGVTLGFPDAKTSDDVPSVTLIRTPPPTLPTYGSLLGGSAEVRTDGLHREGEAVFRAVMGEKGPTLDGVSARELTGTVSWSCGTLEILDG